VWSETSFVPPIEYHTRYRGNRRSYELVNELMSFLETQELPYVIGNGDAQLVATPEGDLERVDYNAVLLYDDGELQDTYRKIHLVPFTEHFPYGGILSGVRQLLIENETTFWESGDEYTIFNVDGHAFATPICFEDTFGYLSRNFVREGADLIVNLTNDSWAYSEAAAMQHMQMAVFRAIENKRSVVRSTNGGMTTVIDPNGKILAMLPAFTEDYLTHDVPVYTEETTLYTRWGNWLAIVFVAAAAASLLFGIGRAVWKRLN
jgi:apolipoprotein N-acyltransferase